MTDLYLRSLLTVRAMLLDAGRSLRDDKGEVNIVATVLLIIVAIGLVIIFKDKLTDLLNSLMDKISGDAEGV